MRLCRHFHGGLIILLILHLLHGCVSMQAQYSCDASDPKTRSFKFCQAGLPVEERAEDLVSRLTLEEKVTQLVGISLPIPRLGIPGYIWYSEALHGLAKSPGIKFTGEIAGATSFPQVILFAATFDSHLWYRIGRAIGMEGRAMFNEGFAIGVTFWAPNLNIYRDPRWGRGQETPGEDPTVASKYGAVFVRGFQGAEYGGKHDGHLLASACCKHFIAYDLDNWKGIVRYGFNAEVTQQDFADTYLPPFKSCVTEGNASSLMCSYTSVNGIPSCGDYDFLTKTVRQEWGLQGYIVSDYDAVSTLLTNLKYVSTPEDSAALVLKAGMDLNAGTYLSNYTISAIKQNKVSESEVDRALKNLFQVRMRLGLFNGDLSQNTFGNITRSTICNEDHQKLALEAARNGIVLLKNDANLLPLSMSKTQSLAVIGPNANDSLVLRGTYYGPPCKNITILTALKGYVANTSFDEGCNFVNCTSASIDASLGIAKKADYVVLVMGLDKSQEKEALDRLELGLPGMQEDLIKAVAAAAKKPVVLVLLNGGPVDIEFAKNDPKIGSIVWAGYPGEAGGIALAEILFGKHNPGGKLPVTWYPKDFANVNMTDMRMRPDPRSKYPGRTYRFYNGPKVFEFGYGLSYTNYSYIFKPSTLNSIDFNKLIPGLLAKNCSDSSSNSVEELPISKIGEKNCKKLKFRVYIEAKNIGSMAGKHPVLLFVRNGRQGDGRPTKELVKFKSVWLNPGETAEIKFQLSPCKHLSITKNDGSKVIEKGDQYLVVGDKEVPVKIMF